MSDLRKLAEAATPGPWTVHQRNATGIEYNPWVLDAQRDFVAESEPPNAAYIAAANPQAVIGLLDKVDALATVTRERDEARELLRRVLDVERIDAHRAGATGCRCMMRSRAAERAYEMGQCPHQLADTALAGAKS